MFSKFKDFPGILSDNWEGKIIEISTLNIVAIGRLLSETLYLLILIEQDPPKEE